MSLSPLAIWTWRCEPIIAEQHVLHAIWQSELHFDLEDLTPDTPDIKRVRVTLADRVVLEVECSWDLTGSATVECFGPSDREGDRTVAAALIRALEQWAVHHRLVRRHVGFSFERPPDATHEAKPGAG